MKIIPLIVLFTATQMLCIAQEYGSVKFMKRIFNPDKDNKIYKREREFQFDYRYTKNDTSYWMCPFVANGQSGYDLIVDTAKNQPNLIKELNFKVVKPKLFARTNRYQSELVISFNKIYSVNERGWTGLVDNKYNVWLHPPRGSLFSVLELNPYPYVKYPLAIGNQWQDSMSIGDHWSDSRWKVWTGSIVNAYKYEVKGKASVVVDNQEIPCWVIESSATSKIGDTALVSYFNEEYGFVKLDYVNIDGSKIVLQLKKLPI